MDRSHYSVVTKSLSQLKAEKQDRVDDPTRALAMVWELSCRAYKIAGERIEPRLQRNVVRLARRGD
jgi:hypothetical protein